MRNLANAICLAVALLMGGTGISWGADWQKGADAYQRGHYATAIREWTPLAKQGDADAQSMLGAMYAVGQGTPQNYKAALKWYRLAAEQGDASAQFALGGDASLRARHAREYHPVLHVAYPRRGTGV